MYVFFTSKETQAGTAMQTWYSLNKKREILFIIAKVVGYNVLC